MTATIEFNPSLRDVQLNPYPLYRRMRDEAPVYKIEALNAYALTRYDDCRNTFLHPELYSANDFIKQAFGDLDPVPEVPSLIALDPPDHAAAPAGGTGFPPGYRSVDRAED